MNKRGVTTQTVIVSIIILIISTAIIFYFFRALPYKEMIDKQACHQSVVLRSNALLRGESIIPETIPLNCRTQEIIISTTNEELIKREIANAMYNCWWMLGEGKLNFISESVLKEMTIVPAKSSCLICATIKFEGAARGKKIDLLSYLESAKIPRQNKTYLEYFSDEEGAELPTGIKAELFDTSQDQAILFWTFESEPLWKGIAIDVGIAAATFGGSYIVAGGRGVATTGSLIRTAFRLPKTTKAVQVSQHVVKNWAGQSLLDEFGKPLIKTVTKETITVAAGAGKYTLPALTIGLLGQTGAAWGGQRFAATYCDGEKKGCSQIMLVPLEAEILAPLCANVESIP